MEIALTEPKCDRKLVLPMSAASTANNLERSFDSVYRLLEVPWVASRVVFLLLIVHSGLLGYSAYIHSPNLNEPGHLVAGLSHWKYGRFELYRVNPPLVRMVAALPVMAAGYQEDWSSFYEAPGARPEFGMGEDFIARNGERSFFLFTIARWACMPFSWIGAIVSYLWARDLFGRPAGVLGCAIWCFEPNILAHAAFITPDAASAALGLAACYTFWTWVRNPSWTQTALSGLVLGLAELTKTTLIIFYPLWPLMWFTYRWPERHVMSYRNWRREIGMLIFRMMIGVCVVNLGYGFEDSFEPLSDFYFISDLFNPTPGRADATADQLHQNRKSDSFFARLPVPLPKNYVLGIDIQQHDFEKYNQPSYLAGQWRNAGWWYYYLYAAAIKVPISLWMLCVLAAILQLVRVFRTFTMGGTIWKQVRDQFILLCPPLLIFVVASWKSGFSEHMRYILPCFGFFFVWIAQIARIFGIHAWSKAARPESVEIK